MKVKKIFNFLILFYTGDTKEEETEEIVEEKPVKGKKAPKKAIEALADPEEEPQDTGEQPAKRRRKQAEEKGK